LDADKSSLRREQKKLNLRDFTGQRSLELLLANSGRRKPRVGGKDKS